MLLTVIKYLVSGLRHSAVLEFKVNETENRSIGDLESFNDSNEEILEEEKVNVM